MPPNTSPTELPAYYIELYKLAIEMADRISARRAVANSFFLTLQSALAALSGFLNWSSDRPADAESQRFGLLVVALVGIALSSTWWVLIRSYRDLNRAKFSVILEMEKRLEVKLFGDEWATLKKDPLKFWVSRYAEFSFVERVVPIVFALVYVTTIIHLVVN